VIIEVDTPVPAKVVVLVYTTRIKMNRVSGIILCSLFAIIIIIIGNLVNFSSVTDYYDQMIYKKSATIMAMDNVRTFMI
jgi:hypothetical protein